MLLNRGLEDGLQFLGTARPQEVNLQTQGGGSSLIRLA